jgi:hypothetical protein
MSEEGHIMYEVVVIEDPSKGASRALLGWTDFIDAISDIRIWLHGLLNILALSPKGGLQLYGPTIIKSLGFSKTKANLLNSVSSYLVVIFSVTIFLCSDKTGLRGSFCIIAYLWSIAFGGALLGIGINSDKWVRYAIFTHLGSGNALAQGLNNSWININAMSPHKRSMGLVFVRSEVILVALSDHRFSSLRMHRDISMVLLLSWRFTLAAFLLQAQL